MKNFALGAFISLLVAAAALQALAQSSDEQRGGDAPASAAGPSASADACKADAITVFGQAKFRRLTLEKELGGAGSAMADAVTVWEREAGAKFGDRWKTWSRATERSLECGETSGGGAINCTISGRPCESDTVAAAADKGDPSPTPLAKVGPPVPAAPNDRQQVASDAPLWGHCSRWVASHKQGRSPPRSRRYMDGQDYVRLWRALCGFEFCRGSISRMRCFHSGEPSRTNQEGIFPLQDLG
jgi:hypothetical protein